MVAPPTNSNETYCTFTLASDVTAGGLPSEEEIAKDLESSDDNVSFVCLVLSFCIPICLWCCNNFCFFSLLRSIQYTLINNMQ